MKFWIIPWLFSIFQWLTILSGQLVVPSIPPVFQIPPMNYTDVWSGMFTTEPTEPYMPIPVDEWTTAESAALGGYEWSTPDPSGGGEAWTTPEPYVWSPYLRSINSERSPHAHTEADIKFYLYTRANPDGKRIWKHAQALKSAGWKTEWQIKFLIAGYFSDPFDFMLKELSTAYLLAETKANIVVVDWGKYADGSYSGATRNMEPVAVVIAKFIVFLSDADMLKSFDSVHILGHSLGAHLAGAVGTHLRRQGKTIGRITGLDAAGPGFDKAGPSKRLDKSDAAFVDAIHTNGPPGWSPTYSGLGLGSFGTPVSSGHADFYPNGGESQPGCTYRGEDIYGLCSHKRAVEYYARSIRSKNLYPSCPCQSWAKFVANKCPCDDSKYLMGENCSNKLRGSFYLRT